MNNDTAPDPDEPERIDHHADPRLNEPGTDGMPGSFIDSEHNLPGQQGAPPPPPRDHDEPADR